MARNVHLNNVEIGQICFEWQTPNSRSNKEKRVDAYFQLSTPSSYSNIRQKKREILNPNSMKVECVIGMGLFSLFFSASFLFFYATESIIRIPLSTQLNC